MTLDEVNAELAKLEDDKARISQLEEAYLTIRRLLQREPEVSASDVDAVRHTATYTAAPFTSETLFNDIATDGLYNEVPRAHVRAILSKMAKDGEIAVVEQGSGRRPSLYSRKPSP